MQVQPSNPLALIPTDDLSSFNQETAACRRQVLAWMILLVPLVDKKNRGPRFEVIAKKMRTSAGTVKRLFYAMQNHGWEGLINRSKYPHPHNKTLPYAFSEFWKSWQEKHQRDDTGGEAHRKLLDRLDRWTKTGEEDYSIPGYDHPPICDSYCRTRRRVVPIAWSYRNLIRHKPRTINLILSRRGPKAAAAHLPNNYTTRAGLRLLERVFFDDQEYDNKVVLPGRHGNAKPMRPMGFNALDHLTGKFIHHTIKLTRWDVKKKKKKQLNQRDFVWMVIGTLQKVGYRTDKLGTAFIFEHGTASGYKGFDDALTHITGGSVKVLRSGRFGDPMFSDMHFRGQSTGNFRYKAPLESIFHLVRTTMAALPGATGRHFGAAPEESYGLDSYGKKMIKLYNSLSPEIANMVRFPCLTFNEFLQVAQAIYTSLNHRTDHNLEGWEKADFIAPEWQIDEGRRNDLWLPRSAWLDLSPAKRDLYNESILTRARYMAPHEAFEHQFALDKPNLTRLPEAVIPTLIPIDWAYPVKVTKQHEIIIRDRLMDSEPMIYLARVTTANGRHENLRPNDHFKALLNPYNPERLLLIDNQGRYVGAVDRFIKPVASDVDAIVRNQGRINQFAADITQPAKRRAQGVADARQEMIKHNQRLADGRPVTKRGMSDEKKAARRQKKGKEAFAQFIKNTPPSASPTPPPKKRKPNTDPFGLKTKTKHD